MGQKTAALVPVLGLFQSQDMAVFPTLSSITASFCLGT